MTPLAGATARLSLGADTGLAFSPGIFLALAPGVTAGRAKLAVRVILAFGVMLAAAAPEATWRDTDVLCGGSIASPSAASRAAWCCVNAATSFTSSLASCLLSASASAESGGVGGR